MADDTWDLAQTAAPPPPPSAAPAAAADPTQDYIRQQLALLQAPLPSMQPDTTPVKRGWLSLLGEAIGGGQTTGVMSPAQSEVAGLRALRDFGTSLIAGSGYHPGQPALGAFATGFQGAEQSVRGSEQGAAATLGAQQTWQMEQQKLQLERLKEAMPLLTLQQFNTARNTALGSGPAVPGTASGAGTPGGGGLSALAYGQGGPGSTIPVPPEYMPMFEAAAKRNNMPVDLLIAQARQESGFNPNAAGGGLMQIQDKTALKPGFGMAGVQSPAILKDPKTNIDFGADYLAARAKAAGVDLNTPQGQVVGLQAYNGGGDPKYVQNVTRYMPTPAAPYNVATTGAVPGPPSGSTTAPAATLPVPPVPPSGGPPAASTTAAAAPPVVTPPVTQQPAPDRVPPTFTYTRQPLPPDIQSRIDNPPIPPQYDTAVQTALTPEALQTAQNNKAAAIAAAKAKAIDEGEAWQTKQQEIGADIHKQNLTIQQQNDTTLQTQQHEKDMELLRNSEAQTNSIRNAQTTADQAQLKTYQAGSDAAQQQINTIQILRNVEKNMPESGSAILQRHPELLDTLTNMGLPKSVADTLSATDLFQRMLGFLGTQLSQKAAVGAGTARQAEIAQNMSVLPGLATDHNGRQQLMGFLLNLAQYQVNKANSAEDYYNTNTHPRFKDLPSLNGFERQYGDNQDNAIIPQVPLKPDGTPDQGWAAAHVKPGMLFKAPVLQRDSGGKPVFGQDGKPIYKSQTMVQGDAP